MDKLVRCISTDGTLVIMAAETTDMVEKAQQIHQTSNGACVADGYHFQQGYQNRNNEGCHRTQQKAANGDDHILGLVFQKQHHRDPYYSHDQIGNCRQHSEQYQFFYRVFHSLHLKKKMP